LIGKRVKIFGISDFSHRGSSSSLSLAPAKERNAPFAGAKGNDGEAAPARRFDWALRQRIAHSSSPFAPAKEA
jgi:hypothetical protein